MSSLKYDSRFGSKIDINNQCERLSGSADPSYYNIGPAIRDILKKNLENYPTLKWQYFGSEQGLITLYPSFHTSDCSTYDPRFRPWYVAAAVPEPRDIVIVIDQSGSMSNRVGSKSRMNLAKEAAKIVLDTLNPHDNVGVVGFSSLANTRDGCYERYLSEATEESIQDLRNYVDRLTPGGTTDYVSALVLAFQLIEGTAHSQKDGNKRVILFLTDGEPTNEHADIMRTINNHNKRLNYSVILLTYGMNIPSHGDAATILEDMATQNFAKHGIINSGSPTIGRSDIVSSNEDIRLEMGSYYSFFEPDIEIFEPTITVPYFDAFGLGLVTTVAVPVYSGSGSGRKLAGVIGVDVTVADLVEDITYFRRGEQSYAFVIDGKGVTLVHPLMPAPIDVADTPKYINIQSLESYNRTKTDIWSSMKSGGSGSRLVTSQWPVSRGNSLIEGVGVVEMDVEYWWKPIDRTNFSLGLVIPQQHKFEKVPRQITPQSGSNFAYHRFDLVPPSGTTCSQFGRLVVPDKVSVKIAPEGFKDPFKYLDLPETTSQVEEYLKYFNGRTSTNEYFKPTVRTSLLVVSNIERDWLSTRNDFTPYIVWRYIGTPDGVFIVLPGIQQPNEYDHTKRPWYNRAIAYPGKSTLSAPYLDAFGAGYVVTLSHTIARNSLTDPEALAVASMDFTLPYFWRMLSEQHSDCRPGGNSKCFVIDSSGYVIIHESFVDPATVSREGVEDRHVTEVEPGVARVMITNSVLRRGNCNNYQDGRVQYFYTVDENDFTASPRSCPYIKKFKITGTNAHLVVVDRLKCSGQRYNECNCPTPHKTTRTCDTSIINTCACPCSSTFDYNKCVGLVTLNTLNNNDITCPPAPPPLNLPPIQRTTGSPCSQVACSRNLSYANCFGVVGCEWCSYDNDARQSLSNAYCADSNVCPLGVVGGVTLYPSKAPTTNNPGEDSTKSSSRSNAAVGTAVSVVVVVVVFIIITTIICKRRNRNRRCNTRHENRSTERPAPSNPSAPPVHYMHAPATAPSVMEKQEVPQHVGAPPAYHQAVDLPQPTYPYNTSSFAYPPPSMPPGPPY
ncbi:VWFA and cache domain-containing protein 1-like isoform X2 [Corticium candelabrum]|uniref:VWFA and cache domain-containing protein 1-like isoform X2 n=1 Tax=Corticium candelabrum TaxID=121492 RepID=UPI002E268B85|nr:VWFA and cache domain-containing protein 1-like isoform X2 [Corticium candelabrum]